MKNRVVENRIVFVRRDRLRWITSGIAAESMPSEEQRAKERQHRAAPVVVNLRGDPEIEEINKRERTKDRGQSLGWEWSKRPLTYERRQGFPTALIFVLCRFVSAD